MPQVELVRIMELVEFSFCLPASENQIYFADSYVVDQLARLISRNAFPSELTLLIKEVVQPKYPFVINENAETAIMRMRQRPKEDALLLSKDVHSKVQQEIESAKCEFC
jgi:hypothetical protein